MTRRCTLAAALAVTLAPACSRREPPRAAPRDAAPAATAPAAAAAPPDAAPRRGELAAEERAALTGTIVAAAGPEGAFAVVAIPPAGGAPTVLTPPGASYYPSPGPLPLAIAVTEDGDAHEEQLVLLGRAPAQARRLGPRGRQVRSPTAHPGLGLVVVEAEVGGARDLYRVDARTGAATRLTDDPHGSFEPSLSPDGARVAFTASRDGDAEIYVMPAAGGAATRVTFFHRDDWAPLWSPAGDWLAVLSDREGAPRLYLVKPDGTGWRPAAEGVVAGEQRDASWSPDGARLAFVVSTRDGASEVWIAEAASGAARRLSAPGARDEAPAWSPDGRHLVFASTRDQRIDLWLARADGTAESPLTASPQEEWLPRWLP